MATDDDDPFGERDPAPGPGAGGSFGPCCVVVALVTALVGVLATFGGVPLAAHHGPRLPLAVQRAILDLLMGSHVQQLSAAQPDALKEVFFGGEPWIVQCSRTGVVSAAFVKAPTYLGNLTTFALLDCEEPLPSGKGTRERFKLGGAALFTAANGNGPRPVPASALTSAYALAAHVRSAVALPLAAVTSDEQLAAGCHARPCLVLSERAVSGATAQRIAAQHRTLRIVTVPASHELRHRDGALALALARVDALVTAEPTAEGDGEDGGAGAPSGSANAQAKWLERVYDGQLGDERALAAFASTIPPRAAAASLGWFDEVPAPPAVASRRTRGQQRTDEASRRAQMAREEEAYAKSLFAADDADDDDADGGDEGDTVEEVEQFDE